MLILILISIIYILFLILKKKECLSDIQKNKKVITNINSFIIKDDTLLFFEIFYKKNKIYMILPIYNSPYNENNIKISVNNKILTLDNKIVKDSIEPTLIFIYKYKSKKRKIKVSVSYNNITKNYILHNLTSNNKKYLTLTTLFKDDYKLFPIFYKYYKDQGVEHFYMYYNGIITDDIKSIFNVKNVTLIQWNFRYWNPNSCKYINHAQLGQMHHAIYKYGKNKSKYMIFCDLDEYMNISGKSIKNFILENKDIDMFHFCNYWSRTIDNKIPDSFPEKFWISEKLRCNVQSKNIFKIKSIDFIGIHEKLDSKLKSITDLKMYHFFNWSNHDNHRTYSVNYKKMISLNN